MSENTFTSVPGERPSKRQKITHDPGPQLDPATILPVTVKPEFGRLIAAKAQDIADTVNFFNTDPVLAQRYLGKDDAVREAREYYQRATDYAPRYPVANTDEAGEKGMSMAAVERVQKKTATRTGLASPLKPGATQATMGVGMWTANPVISAPAERDAAYDLVLLNMICQAFLNNVKSVEIEAMSVADRVVVSANKAADVTALEKLEVTGVFESEPGRAKLHDWQQGKHRDLRSIRSNLNVGDDPRDQVLDITTAALMFPDSHQATTSLLRIIAKKSVSRVSATIDNLGSFLKNKTYADSIILIKPLDKSHAEQALMLALIKSDYDQSACISIAGGKRPCTICYLSLCITREHYPNLRFGTRPGGLYLKETKGGLDALCKALDIDEELLEAKAKHYLGAGFRQFITEYKEISRQELAQALARKGKVVTEDHLKQADDRIAVGKIERTDTLVLDSLEKAGLSSKQPTVSLHPQFDRATFGQFDPSDSDSSDETMEPDSEGPARPSRQDATYLIGDEKEFSEVLALANKENWRHLTITSKDPAKQVALACPPDLPLHLAAGANFALSGGRALIIGDNVTVSLSDAMLATEVYHKVSVQIGAGSEAQILAASGSSISVTGGILWITGADAAKPVVVRLAAGTVRAREYVLVRKVGTAPAQVQLGSSQVALAAAPGSGLTVVDNGFKPQIAQ